MVTFCPHPRRSSQARPVTMLNTWLATLVFLALLLSACVTTASAQDAANAVPVEVADGVPDATVPDPRVTLLTFIRDSSRHRVLARLLPLSDNFDELLGRITARLTFFAPTDDAFAEAARKLLLNQEQVDNNDVDGVVDAFRRGMANVRLVTDNEFPDAARLLKYHATAGGFYSYQELQENGTVLTMAGIDLHFADDVILDEDPMVNTSTEVRNVLALNGWLNSITTVLFPFDLSQIEQDLQQLPPTPLSTPSALPSVSLNPSPLPPSMSPSPVSAPPDMTGSPSPVVVAVDPETTEDAGDETIPDDASDDETVGDASPDGNDTTDTVDEESDTDTTTGDDADSAGGEPVATEEGDDGVCFPASSRIHMADGRTVRMDKLQAGMHVAHDEKYSISSRVFLFSHRSPARRARFVTLSTSCSHSVTLTPSHYIHVIPSPSTTSSSVLVAAGAVRVGDVLRTVSGACVVQSVRPCIAVGLFAPHALESADLVVDGVIVSSYSKAIAPRVAHALMAPLRFIAARASLKEPLGSTLYEGADWTLRFLPRGADRHHTSSQ